FDVAPFEPQAVRLLRSEQPLLPCLEGHAGAAGEVAALDAEVVDLLGEIERRVAAHAEIEKRVEPFAAGVEAHRRALVRPFAQLAVPGAEPLALKAGPEHDVVLVEARDVARVELGAAPVVIVERAPRLAVAVLGLLFLDVVDLQDRAPAHTGV